MASLRKHNYPILVHKDQPGSGDVHVDTPEGSISVADLPAGKKPRKPRKLKPDELEVRMLKADDEQQVIYGIVLEPDTEDTQGDVVSKQDVELAAHRFLYQHAPIGVQHASLAPESVRPVESYIAPCDFTLGGEPVAKGSWVLAAHVPDEGLWEQVRKGDKAAWSIGGTGRRSPLL